MSEGCEGRNLKRREAMKKWKAVLAVFLSIVLVLQSSNIQALADVIVGDGESGREEIVLDKPAEETEPSESTDEQKNTPPASEPKKEEPAEPAEPATPEEPAEKKDDSTKKDEPTQTTEPSKETSSSTADKTSSPETEAPAETPAEEADTTVTLNVEISGAKLTYSAEDGTEQNVTPETDPKSVDVPNTLDFKFTVTPDEGHQISSVSYGETVLTADEAGEYTVAAADLTDGEKIVVTTEAVPAEETPAEEAPAEEVPAEPEAPAEGEVATEPTEGEATPEEPTTDGTAEGATPTTPEVLDPEDVVADVSSPAYEGYAYVGDIVVKVTAAEGVLPEGTTVSAYQVNRQDVIDAVSNVVEQNGKVVENSVAIDVTLLGPDGNVIQPDGAVNVCFFNSNVGDSTVNVYRVADDASTVQAVGTRQADASVQSFDVDHFSIYVVTEEGEPALATYNFHVNDEIVSTQVVKTGDTLYEPTAPEANDNGFKFTGWYTKEQGGDLFDGFGGQNVSENKTVDLYAQFEEVHYVFFYDNQDRIFHTEEGVTGHSVSVGEATQILEQSLPINQGLAGWYTSEGFGGNSVESVTLENANIYLYPKVVDGHWITFNTEGGTYIEPQFVAGGATSIEPETPTRTGYTFVGWETEDGKSFDFGDELTDDVKLVARWNPGQTSYRVIYWVEKANWKEGDNEADRYSFMSSEVINNVGSGSTTNVSGINRQDWGYSDLSFDDAELQTVEQKTVAGDGSTIVNVYYNRAEYKVVFKTHREGEYKLTCTKTEHTHEYEEREWFEDGWFSGHYEYTGGCYGSGWHQEGQTNCGIDEHQHTWWGGCYEYVGGGWSDAYVIEAKVGAYIGDQWPTSEDVDGGPYRWAISESAQTWQAHMEVMPSGGDEFWGQTASGTSTATYWVENVEGTGYEVHHRDVSAGTGMGVSPEDKYELQGFTYDRGPVDGSDYSGADFYYTRNDYTVSFINGDEQQDRAKPYQASLDDLANTPNKPSTVEENFVFAGWYDNQFGEGEPFNFDTTMPAYNLSLYAVWKAPEVSVSYYGDMDGTGSPQTVEGVSYGETINENRLSEPAEVEGKQFVGWATRTGDEGNYAYTLFNFDTEIRSDVVLYPYYISTGSYKVTYSSNGASGTAPTDEREYAEDAYADVLSAEGMTAPEGEVFLGWSTNEDGTGTLYQPEDKILIEGNVTLYAHWGHRPSQVTVTYNANYPEDAVSSGALEEYTTDSFPSNAEHTVFEFEAIDGFEVPDGYKFVGWTNGSATYKPGDKVRVDELQKGGDNTLTAQWTHVGTQIYVKVVLDGNQVAAKNYVNPVVDGTTQGFMATYDPNTQLYTIDYTYENFNCADFKLVTFDIPAGYVVSVSSNNTNDTTGIDGSTAEYHDPVEENGNWTLDNVPGGATVTVDLHKSEYIVKYVADDNGSVSTKQEVVKYGENANGSTATPDDGYFFVNWTDSEGEVVSTDPTYVPQNITANATYTAHFAKKYEVTVTAKSGSKTYDGTELAVSGFENEVEGKGIEVTAANGKTYYVSGLTSEAKGTDVDDSVASIAYEGAAVVKDADGNDVSKQFNVKVNPGSLTISKRQVTLTSATDSKQYDGEPLTNSEVTVSGEGWAKGEGFEHGATYDVTGSQTIVGNSKNTFTYTLTGGASEDNYSITKVEGTLTVSNRDAQYEVTVTAKSGSKTYDGTELAVSGFENEVEGKGIEVTAANGKTYYVSGLTSEAKGTDVDDSVASIAYEGAAVVKDADGNDVSKQFNVKVNPGSLTISKRQVTLTSATDSKQYDGEPLTNSEVTVSGEGWAKGEGFEHGATYDVTGSQTIVGNSKNTFTYTLTGGASEDNYSITKVEGTLTVSNRDAQYEVTVTAKSGSKTYDGTELAVSGFENEVEGKGIEVTAANGKTYYVSGLTSEAKGTDVDDSVASIAYEGAAVVKDADGNDVSKQFNVKVNPGSLTISKRQVTLTSATDSKQYDGEPLTNSEVTVSGEGWAKGEGFEHGATYDVTGSQTIVGNSKNTFTYTLTGGASEDNYSITKVEGTLTVSNRDAQYEVTVTAKSGSKTYDGTELAVSGFENEVEGKGIEVTAANGKTYYVSGLTSEAKGTDVDDSVASIAYEGAAVVKDADGNDVSKQFNVKVNPGSLTISKRQVTLTSATDSKQYDGEPLTNSEVTVSGEGWAKGEGFEHGATYDVTGSQTIVGNSKNTFTYTLTGGASEDNYSITKVEGTLTVSNRDAQYEVTVTAKSGSKTYDGTELAVSGFENEVEGKGIEVTAANGKTYYVSGLTSEAKGTDVDDSVASIAYEGAAVVKDADGNDVSKQFNVKVNPGSLTISKRQVTLTSATDSKQYDGEPLTNSEVTVSGEGWAKGEGFEHGATYDVTGSQTIVGNSKNTFTYTLTGGASEDNYSITKVEGTLTVSESPIGPNGQNVTLSPNDVSEIYDGESHAAGVAAATDKFGNQVKLEYSLDGEKWTENPADITATNVSDSVTVKVRASVPGTYTGYVEGTQELEVTARPVTITTNDAAKVFDGTELTNETYEVTFGSFVDGETYGVDFGDSGQTAVGVSENDATVVFAGEGNEYTAQAGNYTVTVVPGTLQVFPQSIDPTDPDPENPDPDDPNPGEPDPDNPDQPFYTGAKVEFPENTQYNAAEQKLPVLVTDAEGKTLTEGEDYTVFYSEDVTNVGAVEVTVTGKGNYAGTIKDEYQITQAPLTIETPDATKVYDGTALTTGEDSAVITGLLGDDQVQTTVYGSQVEADTSSNHVRVDGWINTEAGNYDITFKLGTLTVTPQTINPDDPDNPGSYGEVEVSYPQDVPYNGTDQTWVPTVTDGDKVLVAGTDYEVSYSTSDRTNVTGTIKVTITGEGNYTGSVERYYQITRLTITVTPRDIRKTQGQADPALTSDYSGYLLGEIAGWTGALTREPGEAVGTYTISQGSLQLADNPAGNFLARNYNLVVNEGTFTIVAAPVTPEGGGDNPTPTPGGGGDGTPTPGTPATVTPADDTTTDDAETEEAIDDDTTPLVAPTETIDDGDTPLAAGKHEDCWVHWIILIGMILSSVYFVGVSVRRRKFTSSLLGYENKVLDNDRDNA